MTNFEFDIKLHGFSEAYFDQLFEAAEHCNAHLMLSYIGGEENLEHVCEHRIAETALETLNVAIYQKYRLVMSLEGDEFVINLYNNRPGETTAQ